MKIDGTTTIGALDLELRRLGVGSLSVGLDNGQREERVVICLRATRAAGSDGLARRHRLGPW